MRWRTLIGTTFAILLAAEAKAGVLITPPLIAESTGSLVCEAVNVSNDGRDISVWIIDANGGMLNFNECFGLSPGVVCSVSETDDTARYCKVLIKGGKHTVRASLMARSSGGVTTTVVSAQ